MGKIAGERVLRTCGGLKFIGPISHSNSTVLSPSAAHVNFVVPSQSILRNVQPLDMDFPSRREPGIFTDVLSSMNTNPDVCF